MPDASLAAPAAALIGVALGWLGSRSNQTRALQVDVNRYWTTRLHEAAADLVTSYMIGRSRLVDAHDTVPPAPCPPDGDRGADQRRDAQARLFTLPDGDELRHAAAEMRAAMDALVDAYDGPAGAWDEALRSQMSTVRSFQRQTRALIDQRSSVHRRRAPMTTR